MCKGGFIKPLDMPDAMPLRYMRPLDEESWNKLVAALKRGPTPEQVEIQKRLLEIAERTKSNYDLP